ncbi:hypothetical protein AB0J89_03670 [Micromonospora chokoriensis]
MTTAAPMAGRVAHGLTYAVLGWAVAYGGVRLAWTVGESPEFGRFGSDLLGFTGWPSVALCVAAGVVAVALDRQRTWRPVLAGIAWTIAAALVAAAAILLPEVVALLLFAVGPHVDPVGMASRLGCVTGAALLALATFGYQRRTRGDCPACCRTVRPGLRRSAPARWARWAAYAAVAGLVARFAAQVSVGFDGLTADASVIALEIGLVLAGVLLPLALTHRWGEVWPSWVPLLAGRPIPRLLLLVPGLGLGIGIVAYFGTGLAQVASGSDSEFSDTFLWAAMSAYCVPGLGLVVASADYHLRTRRACGACDR